MSVHNNAKPGDVAETVLMPGDPLRAKFIAETYLEDPICYNTVRNMLGYTGTYKGKRISVQGSGMGMPSIGIYSYELFSQYGVENIIRIGSAGSLSENVNIRDVVIAMGACTNSNYASQYELPGTYAPVASYGLLRRAVDAGERLGAVCHVGNVLSSDTFYDDADSALKWQKMNVLAIEMEAAALYMNAARLGKNALCILTISDSMVYPEQCTTPEERQKTFTDMMEIALETAVN